MSDPKNSQPHDLQAEAAVLGAVLLDNAVFPKLDLEPEFFFREGHREILRAMYAVAQDHRPIDTVTLSNHLRAVDRLQQAGGGQYLVQLSNNTPAAVNIEHYAQIVRGLYFARRVRDLNREFGFLAIDDTAARRLKLTEIARALDEQERGQFRSPRLGSMLNDAITTFAARVDGTETAISTPWVTVDEHIRFWPGLYVLVGGTGSGKSQFALQWALHAAKQRTPVLYIGLELGSVGLVARLLGLESGQKWSRLYQGDLDKPALANTLRWAPGLGELPFHMEFVDPMGWPYTNLAAAVAGMVRTYKRPPLVIVDYLQLVSSPTAKRGERQEDLRERIGRAAYLGRAMAREHKAVVLMISSTARDKYKPIQDEMTKAQQAFDEGRTPSIAAAASLVGVGKESGEVEFAADGQMVLARTGDIDCGGAKYLLTVSKVRAGVPAWIQLKFDGGRFDVPLQNHHASLGQGHVI